MENPRNSYLALIYESFIRIHGWVVGLAALALTVATSYISPDLNIGFKWFVLLGCLFFVVVVTLIDTSYKLYKKLIYPLPKIIASGAPQSVYPGAEAILLLQPSDFFAHESLVSVFMEDGEFERLVAAGYVATIQQNGSIQVVITHTVDLPESDWLQRVIANQADIHKRLLVKPTFPKYFLNLWENS